MATEAQRLIGISLTKIAQSRSHRGGVSLHKNLLVATVLQKARYIFMEEAYNMVHYQAPAPILMRPVVPEDDLVGLTAEEAGSDSTAVPEEVEETASSSSSSSSESDSGNSTLHELLQQSSCLKCIENQKKENQNKENQPPYQQGELTYLDLDKNPSVLRERSNSAAMKRRRAVAEWETEEAVQSILPKRSRQDQQQQQEEEEAPFLDDATLLSDTVSREVEAEQQQQQQQEGGQEIDRITSLVSIFSFSVGESGGKLNRSMSTPDLCSAQAKDAAGCDGGGGGLQQRPFLAMTV